MRYKDRNIQTYKGFWDSRETQLMWKNSQRETVKTGYKYTQEYTKYAGLKVSGEELNTYEN